jgi:hypothetical protein
VNLTTDQYRVLAALRGATVLRREPKPLTPDGTERWWSLDELALEDRLGTGAITGLLPEALRAAKWLRARELVRRRRQFAVTRYSLTLAGIRALTAHEEAHGLTEIAAAELELRQAREDHWQAWKRIDAAQARLSELQLRAGAS